MRRWYAHYKKHSVLLSSLNSSKIIPSKMDRAWSVGVPSFMRWCEKFTVKFVKFVIQLMRRVLVIYIYIYIMCYFLSFSVLSLVGSVYLWTSSWILSRPNLRTNGSHRCPLLVEFLDLKGCCSRTCSFSGYHGTDHSHPHGVLSIFCAQGNVNTYRQQNWFIPREYNYCWHFIFFSSFFHNYLSFPWLHFQSLEQDSRKFCLYSPVFLYFYRCHMWRLLTCFSSFHCSLCLVLSWSMSLYVFIARK